VVLAAHAPGPVVNEKGTLRLVADAALADVPRPDVIVVPGGPGQHAYMTAAGVSAGLDMALTLAGVLAGDAVAQSVQLALEYDPQPPYQAGSPATAPPADTGALRARRGSILT
jgi:hypothetical protein